MNYSLEERETVVRWDAADRIAHIWTCNPTSIRRLDKLVAEFPDTYKRIKTQNDCVWYEVDSKFIRFGRPASEARREASRRAMANRTANKVGDLVEDDELEEGGDS